jgi:hypothetical protein
MRRIDYLVSPTERCLGFDPGALIAPSLRVPLGVLGCALAVVTLGASAEHVRLRAAETDGAMIAARLAAVEDDVARTRAVERDVVRLRALGARAAEIRRSGDLAASRIAALGNRVPAGAWLSSLRTDRAALSVEGGGARLGAVAETLAAFARLEAYSDARLLSVHDDPVRPGVTYALALERR